MTGKYILTAAALISLAIVANGFMTMNRYQISAAGVDGQTVWKIDRQTGRVAICGSLFTGRGLKRLTVEGDSAEYRELNKAGFSEAEIREYQQRHNSSSSKQNDDIIRPECSKWSFIRVD